MPTQQEIVDYYDLSKFDYQLYSGSLSDISMHFGLWDERTKTRREALEAENRVLAELAEIRARDCVIDLGCGYGSTAVWLASQVGCRVVGITLSHDQVAVAERLAKKRRVQHLVQFFAMDFHHTTFEDLTFDVAIAIESVCHSPDKPCVLREAWRILRPSGRIAIADGYFGKSPDALTSREREIATTCFQGVHVPPLPQRWELARWLKEAGFSGITWWDKTSSILPVSKRVHDYAKFLLPVTKILGFFGVRALRTSHAKAFINQYHARFSRWPRRLWDLPRRKAPVTSGAA